MNTLAPSATVTTRDSKGRKFLEIVEAAYNKAELSEEEAQRVNNTPGLSDLVGNFIAGNRHPETFENEEVASSWTYPPEYTVLPLEYQIRKLAEIFKFSPDDALAYAKIITSKPLMGGAEGRFAIVSDAGLAKLFPKVADPAEHFCLGTELVLEKIATTRTFHNYRKGELTKDYLRRHEKTAAAYDKLALEQKGDIWVIDAQLAMKHRGRSVRRARVCFAGNEFGLDQIAKGAIILTHPKRFVRWEQLHADCAGAEFRPGAVGVFSLSPFFSWFDGRLKFDTHGVDLAYDCCGSASGFLPQ